MILLERLTGVEGPGGTGAGDVAAGGGMTGVGTGAAATTGTGIDGTTGVAATGGGTDGVEAATGTGVGGTGLATTGVGTVGVDATTGTGIDGTMGLAATGGGVDGADATTGIGRVGAGGATGGGSVGVVAAIGGGMVGLAAGADVGSGGWNRRADLRRIGSTGGMMVLDFLDGSRGAGVAAGLTSVGGRGGGSGGAGIDAVLRVSGSTGGTIGADFLAAGGSDGAEVVMAEVLLGIIGSAEVGAVMMGGMTGGTVDVVRRGSATEGGFEVGARLPPGAIGGGMTGTVAALALGTGGGVLGTGGRNVGVMIGEDFATGSGMFDWPLGAAPSGGVTLIAAGTGGGCVGGAAKDGSEAGCGGAGTSGGWGASGSGTRAVFISAAGVTGSGGIVVREVSARPALLFGIPTVSFVITGSDPVIGSAGGRLWCGTVPTSESDSVLPETKTLACGLAMMTRGGAGTRPEAVGTRPDSVVGGTGAVAPGMFGGVSGMVGEDWALPGTSPVSAGAVVGEAKVARSGDVLEPGSEPLIGGVAGRTLAGVGRTSGSVFAREPVSEPDCLICDGAGPTRPVGGRVGFCIGWVTAVDQVGGGGVLPVAVGDILSDDFIGIVAALPDETRESWVESGFSGRGGSVTRNVSRFWGFDSAEGGASSAIMEFFIDKSEKCSMVKLAMPTSRAYSVPQQPSAVDFTTDRGQRQSVAVDLRARDDFGTIFLVHSRR